MNNKREKSDNKKKKAAARFINPPNLLKEKVGDGGIPSILLTKGQEYIVNNPINFEPYAFEFIDRLSKNLAAARKTDRQNSSEAIESLTRPVMELKANGGMFQYHLISMIADVVLQFLEKIDHVDEDVCDIIEAHNKTLTAIITNKLKGDGGPEGLSLTKELYQACQRYYKKHKIKI